jgi:hypothetical protein
MVGDMKGYIILDNKVSVSSIKYEIGKRYNSHIPDYKCIYEYVNEFDILNDDFEYKNDFDVYKIKIYNESLYPFPKKLDFKIIKKINYRTLNRDRNVLEKRNEYFLYGYKNRDDEIIEEMFLELSKQEQSKAEQYSLIASLKIEKHIKTLRKINRNDAWLAWLTLNRNKDLDKLAKSRYAVEKIAVAQVGRPQDLDILINDNDEDVVRTVLSNGRKKDLEKYIKNPTQEIKEGIFEAGIDKYLDLLEKTNEDSETFIEKIKSIRKKDLDSYLRLDDDIFFKAIIEHGFDEHLDAIIRKKIFFHYNWILKFERQKDIEFLTKKGYI